jgi:hypothetical protein
LVHRLIDGDKLVYCRGHLFILLQPFGFPAPRLDLCRDQLQYVELALWRELVVVAVVDLRRDVELD